MIKKLGLLVPSAIGLVVLLAAPALAGSELPPPNDPNVGGVVVHPPGSTDVIAFTGGNVQDVDGPRGRPAGHRFRTPDGRPAPPGERCPLTPSAVSPELDRGPGSSLV